MLYRFHPTGRFRHTAFDIPNSMNRAPTKACWQAILTLVGCARCFPKPQVYGQYFLPVLLREELVKPTAISGLLLSVIRC
jgi:hypothetical protein